MPHCGKSLYNNLLYANWSPDRLCHVIIIGNSFTNMVQKSVTYFLPKPIRKRACFCSAVSIYKYLSCLFTIQTFDIFWYCKTKTLTRSIRLWSLIMVMTHYALNQHILALSKSVLYFQWIYECMCNKILNIYDGSLFIEHVPTSTFWSKKFAK